MKIAIISDIHSNIEALDAVLEKCEEENVDRYICAGDIVGYNANPVECLNKVRSLDLIATVRGNHDEYAGTDNNLLGFNPYARSAVLWTREQLSSEQREYLSDLKLKKTLVSYNSTLVHATLDSPNSWGYIFDRHHAKDNFTYQRTQICFFGHSHVPVLFIKNTNEVENVYKWEEPLENNSPELTIDIKNGKKYLVNVGSIGQPRNGDPRASFVIYDTFKKCIKRICVNYDIEKTQDKIIKAGLPKILATRLAKGL